MKSLKAFIIIGQANFDSGDSIDLADYESRVINPQVELLSQLNISISNLKFSIKHALVD